MRVLIVSTLELKKTVPIEYAKSVEDGLLPWMTSLIRILEADQENEYHFISTSTSCPMDIKFARNGIQYNILSLHSRLRKRPIPFVFRWLSGFSRIKRKMSRIVQVINPDVISIHGTYGDLNYMAAKFNKPKLITIDMFYDIYQQQKPSFVHYLYAKLERNMLQECSQFTYRTDLMKAKILDVNSNAKLYPFSYPIETAEFDLRFVDLRYDVIYAARLHEYKGVLRYLEIVRELKQLLPSLKAKLIGSGGADIVSLINERIHDLNLHDVLEFSPNIDSKQEFLQILASSKFNVYPVSETMISGTIVESLSVGTPIVTYFSQVLETLNNFGECIFFSGSETSYMANVIMQILHKTSDYKYFSENCLRIYNKTFYRSSENILNSYYTALRKAYENN